MQFLHNSSLLPWIARLLLAFSVIAFLASLRAIGNPEFRSRLLRNPVFQEQGTRITLASAWLSASWWGLLSVVLSLNVFHVRLTRLRSFLWPMAAALLLAWLVTSYFEYRRWKRSS
jgi:hypothetical protein